MVDIKDRITPKKGEVIEIKAIAENNPEQLVGIKTIRVYSQIARMSRINNKPKEKAMLISALEDARVRINMGGKETKKDPRYIPMKASEVKLCFGSRVDKLHGDSFVYID